MPFNSQIFGTETSQNRPQIVKFMDTDLTIFGLQIAKFADTTFPGMPHLFEQETVMPVGSYFAVASRYLPERQRISTVRILQSLITYF